MKNTLKALVASAALALAADAVHAAENAKQVERGRYIVKIAGCNDCHTPGYAPTNGKVPEKAWLTGDVVGWRGPWGTTYPANLRRYFQGLSADQWVKAVRTVEWRPPMPWFSLRDMSDADLRAVHAYVRSLGPAGEPAPAYVPPDREPMPPFVQFPAPPP